VPTYVAFLRAINLGAKRKLPMAVVKDHLADAGYTDVDTHLATGNVRVTTGTRSAAKVRADLERLFAEAGGFDVPTAVLAPSELTATFEEAQALGVTALRRYVAFLPDPAPAAARAALAEWDVEGEGAHLGERHLHWWTDGGTTTARIFSPATLKRLGLQLATTRDLKVVTTLTERWGV
jgi:uncharacterized protein (DUF1697 family)